MSQATSSQFVFLMRILPAALGLTAFWVLESFRPEGQPVPRQRRLLHAARNLSLSALNGFLILFSLGMVTAGTLQYVQRNSIGILPWLSVSGWQSTVLAVVLLDAWTWLWHRANHRLPLLWRFHRVHHGDAEMDVTTSARFHPGELAMSALCRLPVIACLGLTSFQLLMYETLLLFVSQFHHGRFRMGTWEQIMRWLIVTPSMHRVHHSRIRQETNSNYASILSVWDRIFGTYRMPEGRSQLSTGLNELDDAKYQTVCGMLSTPFGTDHHPDA